MKYEQLSLLDSNQNNFRISKPLRLIELFAGYGSQNLAIKYLGITNYESWRTCEWAVKSIQAYKDLHHTNQSYECNLDKENLVNYLFSKGISADYNQPMTRTQIEKLSLDKLRTIYSNIQINNNLVNIQQVHASDLGIAETDKYQYLMFYSFPCQSLSQAGLGHGMKKGSGTRSGMLWEVERILEELNEDIKTGKITELPLLIMENVPQVHSKNNIDDFNQWKDKLTELGYSNFVDDLNCKNFGIPQNRKRCFMVSIYSTNCDFEFPNPIPLKRTLGHLLDEDVDEEYFLSQKMVDYISSNNDKWTGNNGKSLVNKSIASTINTGEGSRRCDASNYIADGLPVDTDLKEVVQLKRGYSVEVKEERKEPVNDVEVLGNYSKSEYNQTAIVGKNGIAPTFTENHGQVTAVPIKNATKQGYLMAEVGDGIDVSSRMHHHRGTVQKGLSQTIACKCDVGTLVPHKNLNQQFCDKIVQSGIVKEFDVVNHSYTNGLCGNNPNSRQTLDDYIESTNGIVPTLTTRPDVMGVVVKDKNNDDPVLIGGFGKIGSTNQYHMQNRIYDSNAISLCLCTAMNPYYKVTSNGEPTYVDYENVKDKYRIRKLTEIECMRLMGVKDEDSKKLKTNQSKSSMYHLAGDSIPTCMLMGIFGELTGINWIPKVEELVNDIATI